MAFSGKGAMGGAASGASAGSVAGPYGALIGGVVGGIGGGILGGKADEDAERRRRIIEELEAEAGPTSLEGMEADPYTKDLQLRALARMANVARAGGMDTQSKARMEQAQGAADAQNRGMQGAITQNFAMRGQGGSGAELVSRMQGAQGYANQARAAGTQAAGDANARALQAIAQQGSMAGSARGQDWGERTDVAGARDAMNQFNAGQRTTKAAMLSGVYGEDAQRSRDFGYGVAQTGGAAAGAAVNYLDEKKKRQQSGGA
jgi:hypothetical protein